jgi:adenylate cyclase
MEEAERAAERIASAARAAAGLIIAAGLTAALLLVTEAERDVVVPRVLIALGIMAGFTALAAISLLVSRTSTFRPWLAYLFVFGDGLLILIALHEGMFQSGHPGTLVFAQPPAWLIPIAIAIQAVRFRTGPLIFAAVLFLVELALLVAFAGTVTFSAKPSPDMGTLFSVPADAIRGLMLAIASTVLVVSVRSKRDILIRGLSAVQREAALSRFLPPEVFKRIRGERASQALAEQRTLAILFIDLTGFTHESETAEPAVVAGWLAEFRERMNRLIGDNGGFVDKFIGDAVMAIFGYECDAETAAAQALRVVEGIPAAMADWQASDPSAPAFRAAVGGALGPVFVGVIGGGDRREFTVVGDAVNVAARLEGFAKEHKASAALGFDLVAAAGQGDRLAATAKELPVRGRREPVRVCLIPRE